jgi:hypothetical protein
MHRGRVRVIVSGMDRTDSAEPSSASTATLLDDLAVSVASGADEDETAPLTREASELEASIFPGVPLS